MSIQEAAATRVPAVSSDLVPFAVEYLLGDNVEEVEVDTGNNPVLKKGEGAIVVPADDVEGFREALEMMLGDEELCDKMGRRALDITVPHFSWHNMVSTFLHKLGVDIPKE
jgi:glycosyltransferase involved in cell wall biosynthesis